jgi:hypothetical protein
MPCQYDFQCSSNKCTLNDNGVSNYGICKPPGWLIAVIVIAGLLLLGGLIALCVCCCCCCRRRRLSRELHVYNHLVDANGRPIAIETTDKKKKKGAQPVHVTAHYPDQLNHQANINSST